MSTNSTTELSERLVGVQHRRKKTKAGEARPTILYVAGEGNGQKIELEDSLAELDFVHGMFPESWRDTVPGENLAKTERHHIKFREPQDNESLEDALRVWPRESLRIETKGRGKSKREILTGIPTSVANTFTGLKSGDQVLGIFGGSGFDLTIALINKASEIGVEIRLTSPKHLKAFRDEAHREKEDDAELLVELFQARPELFHKMYPTDVKTWEVMHAWDLTEDAMDQRKRMAQRAEAAALHTVYALNKYVGSELASKVLEAKMGDRTLAEVKESENEAQKTLEEAIEAHSLYQYLFADIKGCGPRFFGKLMSAIRDIRRFPRPGPGGKGVGAFLRFTGYAVVQGPNGRNTIQRFRRGGGLPGNPEIKQAVWLLVDMQFSRQKDTVWGMRFREIKEGLRKKNPVPVLVCDTEIKLAPGRYAYDEATKECRVTFGEEKEHVFKNAEIKWVEPSAPQILKEKDDALSTEARENLSALVEELRKKRKGKPFLVVPPETIPLEESWKWEVENGLYTVRKPDGSGFVRPGKSEYSKAHIHKIAGWKLGTEFLIHVLHCWWEFVDKVETERRAREAGGHEAASQEKIAA